MKQYGDITQLNGAELEPVDLIVGGSPCQDLSVAGKRAGLEGERSGLFMEMIRLIKEMREKTNGIYPRFALWENVCGAFSSNNGDDFAAVLGEFARIIEPNAPDVPCPEEGWAKAGIILFADGQIAWRTHDAQFWGVPQRRRRISLVADFRGQSASEILFERKGVSGDSFQSGEKGQDTAGKTEKSIGKTSAGMTLCLNDQGGQQMDVSEKAMTLRRESHGHEPIVMSFQERSGKPGGGKGILIQEDHVGALSTLNNQAICYGIDQQGGKGCANFTEDVSPTLASNSHGTPHAVCYGISSFDSNSMKSDNPNSGIYKADTSRTLDNNGGNPACNQGGMMIVEKTVYDSQVYHGCKEFDDGISQTATASYGMGGNNQPLIVSTVENEGVLSIDEGFFQATNDVASPLLSRDYKAPKIALTKAVRRLTPLECTRLQGFPDGWVDIPGASDAQKYKALGNSIALPFWEFLAKRFVSLGGVKTIGSLFDGIGGFPLCFKRAGAKTLWTSEIEPFCQKVVEYHYEKGDL